MNINSGVIKSAQKIVIYGPEGIGKSTFASQFPNPLFSDTEGSTKMLNVKRFDKPLSSEMLVQQIEYVKTHPEICSTYVIDTADWAEKLCANAVCAKYKKTSIEDFGYGKGYVYLNEEFGKILNLLDDVVTAGINVVFTAHAQMRKFEQPDEVGAYDRWELKLTKHNAPMLKEWADSVLFVNYKTVVEKTNGDKYKASGGRRVMFTQHHPCWDAKNRYGLPEETEFNFSIIAPFVPGTEAPQTISAKPVVTEVKAEKPAVSPIDELDNIIDKEQPKEVKQEQKRPDGIPDKLWELMKANHVNDEDIRLVVSQEGYFPFDTPIKNYDEGFVEGWIICFWDKVLARISENQDLPFE